ncbi:SphA family protein [Acuticoccus kandeliae]|uniref:SphA family protein n=1 Tax=Acuticoccus kandeliae TaxID=2073160 RepID=UPI0013001BFB|nr:transporter [Acuticoccus kandeliae]
MRFITRAIGALFTIPLILSPAAHAEEGGSGHYVPGTAATLIDVPPTDPGLLLETIYLGFTGSVGARAQLPVGGNITAGLDATANAVTVAGIYTLEDRILGAFYSAGVFIPLIDEQVSAQVTGPLGNTTRRSDRATGLGDITIVPALMAWKHESYQFSLALPIYAPTGSYKAGHLANPGLNYWTADPTVSVAYAGPKGFNAAAFAGVTINSENPATDYRSGSAVHIEGSVQQLFPLGKGFIGVGANAFFYAQITDDSGAGANLGGFRGRSVGIGPVLDYIVPIGSSTALIEARWLPEIDTKNRVKGDFFWVKGVWQF